MSDVSTPVMSADVSGLKKDVLADIESVISSAWDTISSDYKEALKEFLLSDSDKKATAFRFPLSLSVVLKQGADKPGCSAALAFGVRRKFVADIIAPES